MGKQLNHWIDRKVEYKDNKAIVTVTRVTINEMLKADVKGQIKSIEEGLARIEKQRAEIAGEETQLIKMLTENKEWLKKWGN